ncbi:hypothetical protein BCV73_08775 [Paenibacillus sp. SSG-1]|uniref:hypothetical protein n=1 Tax=Paenibacillus sp. SSG-1 TaxID=1443669 RepID=UPI000B7F1EDA|nr:hypothetical protein [Paenibacillus sp. SSG-1]OXL83161.1 hypothetical protein BCV73_08775 [Paenibacillus sp. SSG-1]
MDKLTEIRKALEASTPGPWEVWEDDGEVKVQAKPDGPNICHVGKYGWGVMPQANLIAHAPEYITYLLQLVETQAQALEWYADEENYEQQWKDHGYWSDPEIDDDRGQRAREAIKLTQV